ncbi:MAG: excinuclease ABC subunit UvrC [Nitrospirae bacterium]|nr:excinuclease ABC subunit UvrC [Nitrospirota bacterium]
MSNELSEKIRILPDLPGTYLMKNQRGTVIYIGKALSLKDRVRSYFSKSTILSARIESMVQHIADIEWIVTGSDLEAFILENNLIKRHRPRYNIILRDDKNYPFLRLDVEDNFPRITVVRRIKKDGALYFGPYVPAGAMRETLRIIKRIFPLATCKTDLNKKYDRPCIEYEIGRCIGPCVGAAAVNDYKKVVKDVRLFLEGKDKELIREMRRRMKMESETLNFEEAAKIRDRIFNIEKVMERQRIVSAEMKDIDVIGMARDREGVDLQILFFRGGMLVGRKDIFSEKTDLVSDNEILTSFIEQYYSSDVLIPHSILLPIALPDTELIEKWLSGLRNSKIEIIMPRRGKRLGMLQLAMENAREAINGHKKKAWVKDQESSELKELLGLAIIPDRIEAFDISNIFGAEAVGSLVVWQDGRLRREEYRHYKIKTVSGADDFAMIGEVVERRYSLLKTGKGERPDLIIIDGGKGQLNSAISVLNRLAIDDIAIIGIAKAKEDKVDRVFLPEASEAIELNAKSGAAHLLQRIRDEAHRFAVSYHRKLRSKEAMLSELDNVRGIGRARKLALLKYFGRIDSLRNASIEDLMKAPKMTKGAAEILFQELRNR